jgi:hypothetical protein
MGGVRIQAPGHPSFSAGKHWPLIGGVAAVVLVAFGTFLWLRPETRDIGAEAPGARGTASNKPDESGQSQSSPPSMPGRAAGASERPTAHSSAAVGTDASRPGPTVDASEPPKASPAGESGRLRLLVPAYIYPGGEGRKEWRRLLDAASQVEIVAIANPGSGPGEVRNPEYDAIFNEAGRLGITVVGYVSTDFCRRDQAKIKKDVDTWLAFYPQIRGFFFDQQPREGQSVAQFVELRDDVKRKLHDPVLITNPGVPCDEAYLAHGVSNVTCVFVNYQGFERFELPAALKSYDPSRFAAMPYNIPDVETMRAFVRDAIVKRIGYIYISDAKQPNPWGRLPVYWQDEVDAIARLR